MEPIDVTEAVQELAADQSAEANADLGDVVMECGPPILNIGIFFDGTYNNAYDNSRNQTNVWRLYQHYKSFQDDIRPEGQLCIQEAFRSGYFEGIGGTSSSLTRAYAGSTGYGSDGVFPRLEQATGFLRETINGFGGFDQVEEVRVDIFGFSRGAATARIFANALADAGIAKLKIRFLGLFDTVASFGIPGDDDQGYVERPRSTAGKIGFFLSPTLYALFNQGELDVHIHANTCETAFQITALDELRAFFPLSMITPPRSGARIEVGCPGNHGDIGGSEVTDVKVENYTNIHVERWPFLRRDGWLDTTSAQSFDDPTEGFETFVTQTYRREVQPGLTRVSQSAMHAQAVRAEVPFHPLSASRAGQSIDIPGPLQGLTATLSAGGTPPPAEQRRIRASYAHRSWGEPGPNMLDIDQVREEYPNQA